MECTPHSRIRRLPSSEAVGVQKFSWVLQVCVVIYRICHCPIFGVEGAKFLWAGNRFPGNPLDTQKQQLGKCVCSIHKRARVHVNVLVFSG